MSLNVHIVQKSVLEIKTDVIVNAANSSLSGGGGVDGAIHNAAGPELLQACKALGGCKTGSAKITKAYNIHTAKYVIHTVGPVYSGRSSDPELLGSCYSESLDLVADNNLKSVAFSCISAGVYGYPLNKAAAVVLDTLRRWAVEHKDINLEVYLCCFKGSEYESYMALDMGSDFCL